MNTGEENGLSAFGKNGEKTPGLVVSTSAIAVLGSSLFLFERLGVTPLLLIWAMLLAISLVIIVFALAGRTLAANRFFVAGRNLGSGALAVGGAMDMLSATAILVVMAAISSGSRLYSVIAVALAFGAALGAMLFQPRLQRSRATTIAKYLSQESALLRIISSLAVVLVCMLLLYAELRLSGLFIAPYIDFSFSATVLLVLILSAFSALAGGAGSTALVQQALFPVMVLVFLAVMVWSVLNGQPLAVVLAGILDAPSIRAALDIDAANSQFLSGSAWIVLPMVLVIGFACLPNILGCSLLAENTHALRKGRSRLFVAGVVVLVVSSALVFVLPPQTPVTANPPATLQMLFPVVIFAASIATTTLLLVTVANTISADLLKPFQHGKSPVARRVFFARLIILLMAIGVWYYSPWQGPQAISMFLWALVFSAGAVFPVLLVTRFWARAPGWALASGLLIGLTTVLIFFVDAETEIGRTLFGQWPLINSGDTRYHVAAITAITANLGTILLLSMTAAPGSAERL